MMKKHFAVAVTIALAAFSIFGCSNSASQSPQTTQSATTTAKGSTIEAAASKKTSSGIDASADKGGKIFDAIYWVEPDFLKIVADPVTLVAEADGNKTAAVDTQQDSIKQIQTIEDFITQDADVVFLNLVDRDAITPALRRSKEIGIPVISFDSPVANSDLADAYVMTDNLQAGKLCTEVMIKDLPEGGLTAVLSYLANSACLDREKGSLETIEGKGFEVVAIFDAEGTVEKGQNITNDTLQIHPDVVAIFSINDQAGMGVYVACMTSGASISTRDVDGAPEAKQVIAKEGSIYRMTAAQFLIKINANYCDVAMTILSGEKFTQFRADAPALTIGSTNIQDYLDAGWQQDMSSGCADSGMSTRTNKGRIKQ